MSARASVASGSIFSEPRYRIGTSHWLGVAGDLLSWKGGLNVLRQARLPKWRGSFKWQIEEKIEALQTEYATLRAECAKPDGYTMPS